MKKNPQLTIALLALLFFAVSCSPVVILYFSGTRSNPLTFLSPVVGLLIAVFLYSRWWMMRILLAIIGSILTAMLVFFTIFTIIVSPLHFNYLTVILIFDTLSSLIIMLMMIYSPSVASYMNKGLPGQKKR